jgi:hypothetical protein
MRSQRLSLIFVGIALLIFGTSAPLSLAQEDEKKEAAKPMGDSRESVEYQKKLAKRNTLRVRVDEANKLFADLVKRKAATNDRREQLKIAEQMMAVAKDRDKQSKDYEIVNQEILYKFPSQGQKIDKQFTPKKDKGPDESAEVSATDERLTELKKRMDKKYAPLMPAEEMAARPLVPDEPEEKPKKLRLEK